MRFTSSGGEIALENSVQWQPTLTSHDPNPPITLENPGGGTTITLTADKADLTLTPRTATFVILYPGSKGDLTLTGRTATLVQATVMQALKADLVIGGENAGFVYRIAASQAVLTVTGRSLTGLSRLAAGKGNLVISPQDVTLDGGGAPPPAQTGSWVIQLRRAARR